MPPDSEQKLRACLTRLLGADPVGLAWPQGFTVFAGQRELPGVFDRHNALVTLYGAAPGDFENPDLAPLLVGSDLCSRVLVLAETGRSAGWSARGFGQEGTITGYWAAGGPAELWARVGGDRAKPVPVVPPPEVRDPKKTSLPAGWLCRPAEVPDAELIRLLLRLVFPAYPIPEDPGTIRYAIAAGEVHGRLVCRPDGSLAAYASVEFQPGGGAVEITDCATEPAARGRGLMTHLVARLEADLTDVFDDRGAYCLAREDQPGMQKVLAGRGWQLTGRLVNHFREGHRWLSAGLWCRRG